MKKTRVKVSVVMPVYNAEKYLKMSVGSLLNQTLKDIEITCINDNSQDNSLTILHQLRSKDSRIKVINSEVNIGAAETRNKGIAAAQGEYIVFLDSDDFFYPEMLETAYKEASLQQADLVVWGYQQLRKILNDNGEEGIECVRKFIPENSPNITNRVDYLHLVDHVPWNKLVKKELLEFKNVRFQNVPTNDDVFFSMVVAYEANKIVFLDKILVDYYWMREGSLSADLMYKKNYLLSAYRKVYEHIVSHTENINEINEFANYVLESIMWSLGDTGKLSQKVKDEMEIELQNDSWLLKQFHHVLSRNGLWQNNVEFLKCIVMKKRLVDSNPYLYYIYGINKLCEKCHNEGKKVAMWGCGKVGKALLKATGEKSIDVDFLIDENPDEEGKVYFSYKVVPYQMVKNEVEVIIVTASRYLDEIKSIASDKKVISWRQIRM